MIKWRGKDEEYCKNGVYGIYKDNVLIYIGSTIISFKKRLAEHNHSLKSSKSKLYTYITCHKGDYTMRPMLIVDYIQTKREINAEQLGWMELGLISCFRPFCNISGKNSNFIFPKEQKK